MKRVIIISMLLMALTLSALPLTEEGKSPFVDVVRNIRESVVHIKVESEMQVNFRNPGFEEFFRFYYPQMPQTRKSTQLGSGFIFRRDGNDLYIMTNNHVVGSNEKSEISVTLADKAKFEAEVVGRDPNTDLAVIKITVDKDEVVPIAPLGNSDELEVGDWAIAIGNPFGELGLERTVTVGVISAKGRSNLNFGNESPIYQDYIQTDAAINPGNSGGPLLNIKGEVIGVNAAITSPAGGNVGIGFAIPVNIARKVSSDLMSEGHVVRAYLGIVPQEVTPELKENLDLDDIAGVLVARVAEDTPAEKEGLKKGDVIVEIEDEAITSVSQFRLLVANQVPGEKVRMRVIRKGKSMVFSPVLEEFPEDESVAKSDDKPESKDLGIQVMSLDDDRAYRFRTQAENGVIVTQVNPDSPAADAGIQRGDVILEVNYQTVENVKDFKMQIDDATDNGKSVLLYVLSQNRYYRYVAVELN